MEGHLGHGRNRNSTKYNHTSMKSPSFDQSLKILEKNLKANMRQ